ncbi:phosphatases II [Thozetella sp. PMI_491]|nr:phosphatases II [Thozetella sp. PMI_491]
MTALANLILPGLPHRTASPPRPKPPITEIDDRLYLGCLGDAVDAGTLRKHHITAVLSVIYHRPDIPHLEDVPNDRQPCLNHMHICLRDKEYSDLLQHLDAACAFVSLNLAETAQDFVPGAVLIHCRKGVSRSAATAAAYLMKRYRWNSWIASLRVTSRRSIANPRVRFGRQLELWHEMEYNIWEGVGLCGNGLPKAPYYAFRGMYKCFTDPTCRLVEPKSEGRQLEWWERPIEGSTASPETAGGREDTTMKGNGAIKDDKTTAGDDTPEANATGKDDHASLGSTLAPEKHQTVEQDPLSCLHARSKSMPNMIATLHMEC